MLRKNMELASSRNWYLRENRGAVTLCSLSLIIIGSLMVFAGGLITYIHFTQITPPNFDAYYERYLGSGLARILGMLLLLAGLTLFWSASIFLAYVYYRGSSRPAQSRFYYESAAAAGGHSEPSGVKECYIA